MLGAHKDVYVGKAFLERVGFGADHAAHKGDDLVGGALLEGLEAGHHPDHAVFGALADDATIENDHVGVQGGLARGKPHLAQGTLKPLGVGFVHLAADCPDKVSVHL